jgi:hypothetical protein
MTTERDFFITPLKQRLLRANMAVAFAERHFLLTKDARDFITLMDAQSERTASIRAMLAVQALVAA